MEVRPGFAKRAKAIAEATPREAIANLLKAILPREPVRVRPVQTYTPDPAPAPVRQDPLTGEVIAMRDPFAARLKRTIKRRTRRGMEYTVLNPHARLNHKSGTWTAAMVGVALNHTNTATADADMAGHVKYSDRKIDWNWLTKVGYIEMK